MKRYLIILVLMCFISSGCSNTKDDKTPSSTNIETTLKMETAIDEGKIDTSQSSLESNETILDQEFDVEKVLNGVSYKLGEDNSKSEESILKLKGTGRKNSEDELRFQGILEIDGKEYNLIYETGGSNILSYASSAGYTRTYGQVFINNDFSSVSVNVIEDGWSNEDGSMLSYPAETKAEGLEIANKVMEDYLLLMKISKLK